MARKPSPASDRLTEFRAIAKRIVEDSRYARKYGGSTDLNGSLARAMEQAYKQGFSDAQMDRPAIKAKDNYDPNDPTPLTEAQVSSKASTAFYAIGLSNNGRREEFTSDLGPKAAYVQDLHVTSFNRTEPDWRIVDTYGSHDRSISNRTANLMVKRGLLVKATVDQGPLVGRSLLVMSRKGVATYEALHVIPYLKGRY